MVADLPSILSMVLNRGKRENVIADKSALNDVEDLDKTLARIKNDGEYLGEFPLTVLLYGWGDQTRLKTAAADVVKIFGNHEASLIHETYNSLNAYLSIFPGITRHLNSSIVGNPFRTCRRVGICPKAGQPPTQGTVLDRPT